jgi:hypothetical protein
MSRPRAIVNLTSLSREAAEFRDGATAAHGPGRSASALPQVGSYMGTPAAMLNADGDP